MQDRSSGGRYGIWGVNENTSKMDAPVDPIRYGMGTAKGIQDFFGKHYENRLNSAKASLEEGNLQKQQQTLPNEIAALNAKYGADEKFYPLIQEANLKKENANVKEIMARTGLSYAQAKVAMAHLPLIQAQTREANNRANPLAEMNSTLQAYKNAPEGSQEKGLYEIALKNMAMGKVGHAGSANLNVSALNKLFPNTQFDQPAWEKNPAFGSIKTGAGGTYTDPETGEIISTPTNSVSTKNQTAIQAIERVQPLIQTMMKTLPQFQGAKGKLKLGTGTIGNFFGGNSQAPEDYAKGQQAIDLASESLVKGLGLQTTDKSLDMVKNVLTPKLGEKDDQYYSRLNNDLAILSQDSNLAKKAQSSGFDVTPQQQEIRTSFGSKEEAQQYYNSLSPEEKQQFLSRLG